VAEDPWLWAGTIFVVKVPTTSLVGRQGTADPAGASVVENRHLPLPAPPSVHAVMRNGWLTASASVSSDAVEE
jgi:hypothetical protein